MLYRSVIKSVILLLNFCRPSARVWAIHVGITYSIQGIIRPWPWPHIFKEVFKAVSPAVADGDSTAAVARKPITVRAVHLCIMRCHVTYSGDIWPSLACPCLILSVIIVRKSSLWRHPQDCDLPETRDCPCTIRTLPQSHRQDHRRVLFTVSASSMTVHLPNRLPARLTAIGISHPPAASAP
jgi:hypothetical protein